MRYDIPDDLLPHLLARSRFRRGAAPWRKFYIFGNLNRQMVVLDRADWLAWLDLTRPEAELLRPLPTGSLAVEQVR